MKDSCGFTAALLTRLSHERQEKYIRFYTSLGLKTAQAKLNFVAQLKANDTWTISPKYRRFFFLL